MSSAKSALQKARANYQPKLPKALRSKNISIQFGSASAPATDQQAISHRYQLGTVTLPA